MLNILIKKNRLNLILKLKWILRFVKRGVLSVNVNFGIRKKVYILIFLGGAVPVQS